MEQPPELHAPGAPATTSDAGPRLTGWERRLVVGADRLIYGLTGHWVLVFGFAYFLFVGLAFLSPLLSAWGFEGLGAKLFRAYHLVCHQKPERSFFVLGHQVAFCQRDVGVYLGLLIGGILYALGGRRLSPWNWRPYALIFVLPVAVDGLTQLVGLRASNWWLRLGTGTWFGLGTIFFAYPYMQLGMMDTRRELEERFGPSLARLRSSPELGEPDEE